MTQFKYKNISALAGFSTVNFVQEKAEKNAKLHGIFVFIKLHNLYIRKE